MHKYDYPDTANAYHEATHAVIAAVLGLDLRYVTIDPAQASEGYTHIEEPAFLRSNRKPRSDEERAILADIVAFGLCGEVGECKYLGRIDAMVGPDDHQQTTGRVLKLRFNPTEIDSLIKRQEVRVQELVAEWWDCISEVALG